MIQYIVKMEKLAEILINFLLRGGGRKIWIFLSERERKERKLKEYFDYRKQRSQNNQTKQMGSDKEVNCNQGVFVVYEGC